MHRSNPNQDLILNNEMLLLASVVAMFLTPVIELLRALAPVLRELRMILALVLKSKPRK